MRFLTDLAPQEPRRGLAIDEVLLASTRDAHEDLIRLWTNDRVVVVGRSQSVHDEVDLTFAAEQGVPVLRRISGGGTVYHYDGNLNITIVLHDGRRIGSVYEVFRFFGRAIATALIGLCPTVRFDANDLLIDEAKLGGAAQARRGNAVLYHTTVLVWPPKIAMDRLLLAMRPDYHPRRVASRPRATRSLCEATGDGLAMETIADLITVSITDALGSVPTVSWLTDEEGRKADRLAETKYGDDAWNRSI